MFKHEEKNRLEPTHPINILMEEHKILLQFSEKLVETAGALQEKKKASLSEDEFEHLNHIIEHFKDSESHYVREENVLFPYIEKHGITQPPAVMWQEHNEIREIKKNLYEIFQRLKNTQTRQFTNEFFSLSETLEEKLQNHFHKENNILFPMALNVIQKDEWVEIKRQFDDLGYCCFTPESVKENKDKKESITRHQYDGTINFETGSFYKEELETLLNTLPFDITFVDSNDTVRYYSQSKDRIFPRAKAIIGRKVQLCHPAQSLHKVEQILDEFKNNKRSVAEFWINMKGRVIYIRYFPLWRNGKYLGTMEVTQDITEIKKIEGEKRLL